MRQRLLLILSTLALLGSCSKAEPHKPRTEPWQNPAYGLPSGSASAPTKPAVGTRTRYRYDPSASKVVFSLPAKLATPRGSLGAASGELEFTEPNYAKPSARLSFDLASLTLQGAEGAEDPELTRRARDWLEVASEKAHFRAAVFELDSLDLEARPGKSSEASGTLRGRLSLHGFRVPVESLVSVERRADGSRLVVRSVRPLTLKLDEHDIKPRNARGEPVASELKLLGSDIGREARIDFELGFEKLP